MEELWGFILLWFGFLEQTYIIFINIQNNNKMTHVHIHGELIQFSKELNLVCSQIRYERLLIIMAM